MCPGEDGIILSLNLALEVAFSDIGFTLGLHNRVVGHRSDRLLGFAMDGVSKALGVGLGIGDLLSVVSLGFLSGAIGGEAGVAQGFTDGLLGGTDV